MSKKQTIKLKVEIAAGTAKLEKSSGNCSEARKSSHFVLKQLKSRAAQLHKCLWVTSVIPTLRLTEKERFNPSPKTMPNRLKLGLGMGTDILCHYSTGSKINDSNQKCQVLWILGIPSALVLKITFLYHFLDRVKFLLMIFFTKKNTH